MSAGSPPALGRAVVEIYTVFAITIRGVRDPPAALGRFSGERPDHARGEVVKVQLMPSGRMKMPPLR